MGSPLKSEVTFTGTDGVERTLSFSAEALYRLEEQTGKRINVISAEMQDRNQFSIAAIRTLFWAGLLDTHPDLELQQVGAHFSKVDPMQAIELVTKAFNGAFGAGGGGLEGGAVPPVPGQELNGTGSAS
jgi:hypothetical protein